MEDVLISCAPRPDERFKPRRGGLFVEDRTRCPLSFCFSAARRGRLGFARRVQSRAAEKQKEGWNARSVYKQATPHGV